MSIKDTMRIGRLERLTQELVTRLELVEAQLEAKQAEIKKPANARNDRAGTARPSQR